MQKRLFIFNSNRAPTAFLIAFVLVILFETASFFIGRHVYIDEPYRLMDTLQEVGTEFKNDFSRMPGHPLDVVVIGDSCGNLGIIPKIIEEKTGLSCFNFSTNGSNTLLNGYCMLKNTLSANAPHRPRVLILAFSMTKWDRSGPDIEHLYHYANGNLQAIAAEIGWVKTTKLLMPSLKIQHLIRSLVKRPDLFWRLRGDKEKLYPKVRDLILIKKLLLSVRPSEAFREKPGRLEKCRSYRFKVDPFSTKYLGYILELARKNDIRVIYVITTMPDFYQKIFEQNGQGTKCDQWVRQLKILHPQIEVINLQRALKRKNFYLDYKHLNRYGATVQSHGLAKLIKRLSGF